eukprot:3377047-Prymnesium_polylepis.1
MQLKHVVTERHGHQDHRRLSYRFGENEEQCNGQGPPERAKGVRVLFWLRLLTKEKLSWGASPYAAVVGGERGGNGSIAKDCDRANRAASQYHCLIGSEAALLQLNLPVKRTFGCEVPRLKHDTAACGRASCNTNQLGPIRCDCAVTPLVDACSITTQRPRRLVDEAAEKLK